MRPMPMVRWASLDCMFLGALCSMLFSLLIFPWLCLFWYIRLGGLIDLSGSSPPFLYPWELGLGAALGRTTLHGPPPSSQGLFFNPHCDKNKHIQTTFGIFRYYVGIYEKNRLAHDHGSRQNTDSPGSSLTTPTSSASYSANLISKKGHEEGGYLGNSPFKGGSMLDQAPQPF